MTEMLFDPGKLERLKRAYDRAVATGKTEFDFEEHTFFTPYAKHLIEYLDSKFNPKDTTNGNS